MNFESLVKLTGDIPCFDMSLLVQAFDDQREVIRVQISRWMKQGKVIGLRRGMYTLAGMYRHAPLTPAALANQLYRPSYLSGLWALGFYDLVPERVVRLTSVTSRGPQRFENPLGVFDYRNIKQDCFFGYRQLHIGDEDIIVAEPEKALLDHWHLTPGEWTLERLEQMRYQHVGSIQEDRLIGYAERFQSQRLDRAVKQWPEIATNDERGTVTL